MSISLEIGERAPERIASYIVSGIGFLGAGVILKDGASIRGLNTAATLWCTAAVGAFCGLGYVIQPLIGSVSVVAIHLIFRPISEKIRRISPLNSGEHEEYGYHISAVCREEDENHVRMIFIQYIGNNPSLMLKSISSIDDGNPGMILIEVEIISLNRQDRTVEKVSSYLTMEKNVTSVKWELLGARDF